MRRRKKKAGTSNGATVTGEPDFRDPIGWCLAEVEPGSESPTGGHGICGANVADSPSGSVCVRGHGGAHVADKLEDLNRAIRMRDGAARRLTEGQEDDGRELTSRPDDGFEVREGDRLFVAYNGAKLQIAPYSSVELDAGSYSRTLQPGDDASEQWDRIHAYLERKALERARAKLAAFADELRKAKARAGG